MTLAYVTVVDLAARDLEQGGTCVPRVVRVHPRNEALVMIPRPARMRFFTSSSLPSQMLVYNGHAVLGQQFAVGISHQFQEPTDVILDMHAFQDHNAGIQSIEYRT